MEIANFPQTTNSFKRNTSSKSKSNMFTPVILVCVHDLQEDLTVTHDLLYSIFSAYGTIQRILIFERSNTFKSFVEFSNAQSAAEARKKLNRMLLFDGRCRMSIYPSNLQVIKFQNNFPGGVDYTLMRQKYGYPFQMDNFQNHLQSVMQISPRSYDAHEAYDGSPHSYYQGGSSKSSPLEMHSPSSSQIDENDDDILQMVNLHHKESKLYENNLGENTSDNEDNEGDNFNSVFKNNAFSNAGPFEAFKKESFNSNYSPEGTLKAGANNSSSFSYLKKNARLPCFPQTHAEIPHSFERSSFSNLSFMSAFSEPAVSRFVSMEEIPTGLEYGDEKVSQPLHSYSSNINFENVPSAPEHEENLEHNNSGENDKNLLNKAQGRESTAESKENEEKASVVLHVLGIENKEVTARMLFNVFSNFGNIIKLLFIKTRAVALVEFEKVPYATLAKNYLNNVNFMGKPLRITYSKYQTIKLQPGQEEKYPEQLIIGDEKTFRFKDAKNAIIAPPSCTLHISNLLKDACRDKKAFMNYFSSCGEVKAIKPMFGENGKNMCLIKMKSIEECLKAMAQLHDTEFCGRKLQISFSRSKI